MLAAVRRVKLACTSRGCQLALCQLVREPLAIEQLAPRCSSGGGKEKYGFVQQRRQQRWHWSARLRPSRPSRGRTARPGALRPRHRSARCRVPQSKPITGSTAPGRGQSADVGNTTDIDNERAACEWWKKARVEKPAAAGRPGPAGPRCPGLRKSATTSMPVSSASVGRSVQLDRVTRLRPMAHGLPVHADRANLVGFDLGAQQQVFDRVGKAARQMLRHDGGRDAVRPSRPKTAAAAPCASSAVNARCVWPRSAAAGAPGKVGQPRRPRHPGWFRSSGPRTGRTAAANPLIGAASRQAALCGPCEARDGADAFD